MPLVERIRAAEEFLQAQGGMKKLEEAAQVYPLIPEIEHLAAQANLYQDRRRELQWDQDGRRLQGAEEIAAYKRFLDAHGGIEGLRKKPAEEAAARKKIAKIEAKVDEAGVRDEFYDDLDAEIDPQTDFQLISRVKLLPIYERLFAKHHVEKQCEFAAKFNILSYLVDSSDELIEALEQEHPERLFKRHNSDERRKALEQEDPERFFNRHNKDDRRALEAFVEKFGGEKTLEKALKMHAAKDRDPAIRIPFPLDKSEVATLAQEWTAIEKECPAIYNYYREAVTINETADIYRDLAGQSADDKKARNALFKRIMVAKKENLYDFESVVGELNPVTAPLEELEKTALFVETKLKRFTLIINAIEKLSGAAKESMNAKFDEIAAKKLSPSELYKETLPFLESLIPQDTKLAEAVEREELLMRLNSYLHFKGVAPLIAEFDLDSGDLAELKARVEKTEKYFGKAQALINEMHAEKDADFRDEFYKKINEEDDALLQDPSFQALSIEEQAQKRAEKIEEVAKEKGLGSQTPSEKLDEKTTTRWESFKNFVARKPLVCGTIAGATGVGLTFAYAYACYKAENPTDENGDAQSFKDYVLTNIKERKAFFWLLLGSGSLVLGGAAWSIYNTVHTPSPLTAAAA